MPYRSRPAEEAWRLSAFRTIPSASTSCCRAAIRRCIETQPPATGRPASLQNPPEQWDLFGERGTGCSTIAPSSAAQKTLMTRSSLSRSHLSALIVERDLGYGSPGSWPSGTGKGFGIISPSSVAAVCWEKSELPAQTDRKIQPGLRSRYAADAYTPLLQSLPLRGITPWP